MRAGGIRSSPCLFVVVMVCTWDGTYTPCEHEQSRLEFRYHLEIGRMIVIHCCCTTCLFPCLCYVPMLRFMNLLFWNDIHHLLGLPVPSAYNFSTKRCASSCRTCVR